MKIGKVVVALGMLFPALLFSASFNCSEAKTALEKTICSDEALGTLDEYMASYYLKLQKKLDKAQAETLLASQRKWLKSRADACPELKTSCLKTLYKSRIFSLRESYENLTEYHGVDAQELQGVRDTCGFEGVDLSKDLMVYAGGAYSGKKTNYQIDQSGHQATQFDVIVNSPDHPVALILGAYEPSIWNIAWTKGTYIEAVMVTGYHRQAVAGLPNDVPILNSSYDNRGPCNYMYVSDKSLKKINPLSNRLYGRNVTLVYYAQNGYILFGDQVNRNMKFYTSKDNPPDSFYDRTKPLAGAAGLNDMVAKGMLRPSTKEDLRKWATRKEAAYKKMLKAKNEELPPVANAKTKNTFGPKYVHNGYVILKKITIPAGLYGGNSATFFLEKGVPYPDGNLGHSTLYDFNTMTCRGVGCGHY